MTTSAAEPDGPTDKLGRRHFTRLTERTHQNIVRLVQAGNYLTVAAQHEGIGDSTLHLWLKVGRETAAARDAHPDDRAYCPGCDRDRTDDLAAVDDYNAQPEADREGIATLDRCPQCGTEDRPRQWEPTEYQRRCLALLEAVTQADTEAEAAAVVAWRSAFSTDWRAARDFLVRRQPNRWAATTRIAISAEESEQRMDRAVQQVLADLGLDAEPGEMPEVDEDWSGDVSDAE